MFWFLSPWEGDWLPYFNKNNVAQSCSVCSEHLKNCSCCYGLYYLAESLSSVFNIQGSVMPVHISMRYKMSAMSTIYIAKILNEGKNNPQQTASVSSGSKEGTGRTLCKGNQDSRPATEGVVNSTRKNFRERRNQKPVCDSDHGSSIPDLLLKQCDWMLPPICSELQGVGPAHRSGNELKTWDSYLRLEPAFPQLLRFQGSSARTFFNERQL